MRVDGVKQLVSFYTLDVIISVGYRVKSKRGIAFRRWASLVLKDYILKGYSVNPERLFQLNKVIDIISRSAVPEVAGVSAVLEQFMRGLDILDNNNILKTKTGKQIIENNTLAAMTLMIALSRPEEKEIMCLLIMNMLEE